MADSQTAQNSGCSDPETEIEFSEFGFYVSILWYYLNLRTILSLGINCSDLLTSCQLQFVPLKVARCSQNPKCFRLFEETAP